MIFYVLDRGLDVAEVEAYDGVREALRDHASDKKTLGDHLRVVDEQNQVDDDRDQVLGADLLSEGVVVLQIEVLDAL